MQSNPTAVAHSAGSTTLSVTHAGNTYTGTIQRSGAFTTTPRALSVSGETHTVSIGGQFLRTGFDALVTVDVQRPTAPTTCRYIVHWIGTKQGTPNTIPG